MTDHEKPREVFFSYARHDRALVEDVVRGLGRLNMNVWFDEALEGGQAWWDEIITRVQTCDVFVQAVSPAAVDSVACGRERGYAVALGKPVLPVIVEQMPVQQLPSDIARLQLVNYSASSPQAAFELAAALLRYPAAPSLPDPLPAPPKVPMSYLVGIRETLQAETLAQDEQAALFARIRGALRNTADRPSAIELLTTLRERQDVFNSVAVDIDAALAEERKHGGVDQPQRPNRPGDPIAEPEDASATSPSFAAPDLDFRPVAVGAVSTILAVGCLAAVAGGLIGGEVIGLVRREGTGVSGLPFPAPRKLSELERYSSQLLTVAVFGLLGAMVGGAIQLTGRYVRLSNVWTLGDVLRLTVLAAVPAAIGGLIISGDVLAPESEFAMRALATVAFGVAGVGIGLGVASAYTGGIALFVLPLLGGMLPTALFRERTSISAVLVVGFVGIVIGAVIAIRFFAGPPEVEPPR